MDGVRLQVHHVKSHEGNGWNELADAVAKCAAAGGRTFACPPSSGRGAFQHTNLDWVGFEMAARRTGSSRIENGCMLWPEQLASDFRLTASQLIPTTTPMSVADVADTQSFRLSACSFNVQGLGQQQRYIEEQMEYYGYHVVFLQKTKTGEGQCVSQRYYRLQSPAERHWGAAVWISKRFGLMDLAGDSVLPTEKNIKVLHTQPRLLAVQILVHGHRVGLISGHCPHASLPEDRAMFLRTVQGLLHAMKKWSLVLCGIDLNGRLPGHYDTVTGELESDEPDATGRLFAEILGDNGIWAPSTFGALHTGDSATYTHCTGAESRIDFLLLGGVATVDKVGSAVNAAIDNGSPNLDHKAVVLQLCGHLGRVAPRPRLQRLQFDREAMATEEGRQAVANICQAFRQPAWDVHPDEHCRRLEEHLQGEMAKWFPKQPGPGRASFIPDVVWRMRQLKNQLKWRTRGRLQM